MNAQNINDKTKIFIRAPSGTSIHFIGTVIWSLVTDKDIKLADKNRALRESAEINQYHDFVKFWNRGVNQQQFVQYTDPTVPLAESINWFKQNTTFYDTPYNFYLMFVHVVHPDPLLLAFNNTKLVNITFTLDDFDQQAYNWLIKTGIDQPDALRIQLKRVDTKFNKLKNIDFSSSISTDYKLLTYIHKFSQYEFKQNMMNATLLNSYSQFNIKFSDIMTGALVDQLTDLINFIGIEVSQERKDSVIKLINDYATAQTPVPWKLDINDYN